MNFQKWELFSGSPGMIKFNDNFYDWFSLYTVKLNMPSGLVSRCFRSMLADSVV